MFQAPTLAMATNQATITGPKIRPTFAVPKRWNENRPTRMARLRGTTHRPRSGDSTASPSTAPSTVMGGVIIPSPKNSAAPKMPSTPMA